MTFKECMLTETAVLSSAGQSMYSEVRASKKSVFTPQYNVIWINDFKGTCVAKGSLCGGGSGSSSSGGSSSSSRRYVD